MTAELGIIWKVVVPLLNDSPSYLDGNKLFNVRTGKGLLRNIGGMSQFDFFPHTLEPTTTFYEAIKHTKAAARLTGKKLPFQLVSDNIATSGKVHVNFRLYGTSLIILSVKLYPFRFETEQGDLLREQDLRNHPGIFSIVAAIRALIVSRDGRVSRSGDIPKTYPCVHLITTERRERISDSQAVEVVSRHPEIAPHIVDAVIAKNRHHQLDSGSSILIDRQGIFARVHRSVDRKGNLERKFESAHSMFELAVAIREILMDARLSGLTKVEQAAVGEIITSPQVVFVNSTTARRTWELMLKEFTLPALYQHTATAPDSGGSSLTKNEGSAWSDRKKWTMRLLAGLILALVGWVLAS